jgi:sialate O-acetylesterase
MTSIFSGHPRFKSGTRDWFWEIQQRLPIIAEANEVRLINLHKPVYIDALICLQIIYIPMRKGKIIARTVYPNITGEFAA